MQVNISALPKIPHKYLANTGESKQRRRISIQKKNNNTILPEKSNGKNSNDLEWNYLGSVARIRTFKLI